MGFAGAGAAPFRRGKIRPDGQRRRLRRRGLPSTTRSRFAKRSTMRKARVALAGVPSSGPSASRGRHVCPPAHKAVAAAKIKTLRSIAVSTRRRPVGGLIRVGVCIAPLGGLVVSVGFSKVPAPPTVSARLPTRAPAGPCRRPFKLQRQNGNPVARGHSKSPCRSDDSTVAS